MSLPTNNARRSSSASIVQSGTGARPRSHSAPAVINLPVDSAIASNGTASATASVKSKKNRSRLMGFLKRFFGMEKTSKAAERIPAEAAPSVDELLVAYDIQLSVCEDILAEMDKNLGGHARQDVLRKELAKAKANADEILGIINQVKAEESTPPVGAYAMAWEEIGESDTDSVHSLEWDDEFAPSADDVVSFEEFLESDLLDSEAIEGALGLASLENAELQISQVEQESPWSIVSFFSRILGVFGHSLGTRPLSNAVSVTDLTQVTQVPEQGRVVRSLSLNGLNSTQPRPASVDGTEAIAPAPAVSGTVPAESGLPHSPRRASVSGASIRFPQFTATELVALGNSLTALETNLEEARSLFFAIDDELQAVSAQLALARNERSRQRRAANEFEMMQLEKKVSDAKAKRDRLKAEKSTAHLALQKIYQECESARRTFIRASKRN